MATSFDPDAAILDVELGHGPNGFDLARILRQDAPELGLVFLTNIPEPKTIGVDNKIVPKDAAYLVKESVGETDLLLRAVNASLRGRVGTELRQDREAHELSNLSRSQLDLLHLAALGLSNSEIAQRRGTTVRAVENLFEDTWNCQQEVWLETLKVRDQVLDVWRKCEFEPGLNHCDLDDAPKDVRQGQEEEGRGTMYGWLR